MAGEFTTGLRAGRETAGGNPLLGLASGFTSLLKERREERKKREQEDRELSTLFSVLEKKAEIGKEERVAGEEAGLKKQKFGFAFDKILQSLRGEQVSGLAEEKFAREVPLKERALGFKEKELAAKITPEKGGFLGLGGRIKPSDIAATQQQLFGTQATQPVAQPTQPAQGRIRVKRKADGSIGSIEPQEFDPNIFERL